MPEERARTPLGLGSSTMSRINAEQLQAANEVIRGEDGVRSRATDDGIIMQGGVQDKPRQNRKSRGEIGKQSCQRSNNLQGQEVTVLLRTNSVQRKGGNETPMKSCWEFALSQSWTMFHGSRATRSTRFDRVMASSKVKSTTLPCRGKEALQKNTTISRKAMMTSSKVQSTTYPCIGKETGARTCCWATALSLTQALCRVSRDMKGTHSKLATTSCGTK